MPNRCHRPVNVSVLLGLTLLLVFLRVSSTLSADTYSVPQTTGVTLAWDGTEPAPDGYRLYQRAEGQTYDYSQPVWTGTHTSCTVYNLAYDSRYYFVVRAYLGAEQSGDSNEVTFVSPSPAATTYTLSASAVGGGSISPSGDVIVNGGADQIFSISPGIGNYIADVLVDGVSVGPVASYAFVHVTANHSISARFALITSTITASAGSGGSISPAGVTILDYGKSQSYAITPALGYRVADVRVDGASLGPIGSYTFAKVTENHTIHAVFIADTFTITSSAGPNGTISPSGSTPVSYGGTQSYGISANDGYTIADVVIDGVSFGSMDTYTFSNVLKGHTIHAVFAAANQAPIADAGPDQVVDEGQAVTLSGLNSIDADNEITRYQWRQMQGPSVVLSSPDEPLTTFKTPNVDRSGAALIFELLVTDASGATSSDSCIVNVSWSNMTPTADAGVDQTVQEGAPVVIDASGSTDADDGIVSYAWVQTAGPAVPLSDAQSASPFFKAPYVGTEGAALTFEVTVTDAGGLKGTDRCLVNVSRAYTPPVADAGTDQQVTAGQQVLLDGSRSNDPDGRAIVSFRWKQTHGAPVELIDPTCERPIFVAPEGNGERGPLTFELSVTNSAELQATDTCRINVAASADATAPIVDIQDPAGDQTTTNQPKISFSGTASDDREVARVVWENSAGGSGVAVGTTTWRVDRIMLKRGINVITLTAYDTSGNQAQITRTVTRR